MGVKCPSQVSDIKVMLQRNYRDRPLLGQKEGFTGDHTAKVICSAGGREQNKWQKRKPELMQALQNQGPLPDVVDLRGN